MKTEGIDINKFKKENNIIHQMTKEFSKKESVQNDKILDLESKIKFYVETQELIDQKNDKIRTLETKMSNFTQNQDIKNQDIKNQDILKENNLNKK